MIVVFSERQAFLGSPVGYQRSGRQVVLIANRHQAAGTALTTKHRTGGRVISRDPLNRVLTSAHGQNTLCYINVVDTWGTSGHAYYDEDLR